MDTLFLNEHRCKCKKLLLKGIFFDGTLEIKCRKCGTINKIGNIKYINDKNSYLLIINQKGLIINMSSSIVSILGYTFDELVGKHFTKINPTLPKEFGKKTLGPESVLNEDNYFQIDTFHQNKKGEKIPVLAFLKLYQPTENERYVLLSAKIKKEKNNAKILNEKEFDLSKKVCNFYFNIDKKGIVEYISPSAEKNLGFSQEMIVGKKYLDFLSVENISENIKNFQFFSVDEQPYLILDNILKDKDNKDIPSEMYFTSNYNDRGSFIGYRVLCWIKK